MARGMQSHGVPTTGLHTHKHTNMRAQATPPRPQPLASPTGTLESPKKREAWRGPAKAVTEGTGDRQDSTLEERWSQLDPLSAVLPTRATTIPQSTRWGLGLGWVGLLCPVHPGG